MLTAFDLAIYLFEMAMFAKHNSLLQLTPSRLGKHSGVNVARHVHLPTRRRADLQRAVPTGTSIYSRNKQHSTFRLSSVPHRNTYTTMADKLYISETPSEVKVRVIVHDDH